MVITGDAWESILALSGNSDLIGNKLYDSEISRKKQADQVYEIVSEWTKKHTKNEIMDILSDLGIPCSPIKDTVELLNDDHLNQREMVIDVNDPARGSYKAIGCPIKVGNSKINITPPPLLGENTEQILEDLLGFNESKIKSLKKNGII